MEGLVLSPEVIVMFPRGSRLRLLALQKTCRNFMLFGIYRVTVLYITTNVTEFSVLFILAEVLLPGENPDIPGRGGKCNSMSYFWVCPGFSSQLDISGMSHVILKHPTQMLVPSQPALLNSEEQRIYCESLLDA